jgi:outer membrane protein
MKNGVLLLLALTLVHAGFSQQRLTLDDAIRMGLEHNRAVQIAHVREEGAVARAAQANSALLPSLKAAASYHRLSSIEPFAVQLPGMPLPYVISPVVLDNYASQLTLQQPLFTGFRLRMNARAGESLARAATADTRGSRSEMSFAITTAYWALYQARENRKAVEENVARLKSDLQDGENLMKAGMLTRADLLRIRVRLSSAQLEQIDATNDARLAEMNCNNVLALPLETPLVLLSSPEEPGPAAATTLVALEAEALRERADLQALEARTEAAREALAAARGAWWPQIYLIGSYNYSRPNPRILPTKDQWKGTWDVGLSLQMDLWNWGATRHEAEEASTALKQQELLLEQSKENASLEVTEADLEVRRAREKVEVAVLSVQQAQESLRMTREMFKNGSATPTDLLDAEVGLLQATTARTGAWIERALADARLAKAVGHLGEE